MKLLLKKDIPKLGIVGDIVDVSAGYARNYLIPRNLAAEPTDANIRAIAKERAAAEERRRLEHEALKSAAERLADVEVTIAAAANPDGHLYGSVGPREIASALQELGHDVNAAHVQLSEPIKHLDNLQVNVVLAEGVHAQVKVWVVRSGATEEAEEEAPESDDTEVQSDEQSGG
jgi:large subunit ribosomal protein L9